MKYLKTGLLAFMAVMMFGFFKAGIAQENKTFLEPKTKTETFVFITDGRRTSVICPVDMNIKNNCLDKNGVSVTKQQFLRDAGLSNMISSEMLINDKKLYHLLKAFN